MRNNGHNGHGKTKLGIFRGFADSGRLSILDALRDGPRTVREIAALTGVAQADAGVLLDCLLDCGLVRKEEKQYRVRYRLSDPRVGRILQAVDQLQAKNAGTPPEPPDESSPDRN
jgi:ArsR family transcriptional regulator, cadmium/lead-responsive transcriptional repressor